MAKRQNSVTDQPASSTKKKTKKRSRRTKSEEAEEPKTEETRLDLAYFPVINGEPRELVFDKLHEEDVRVLESRGYKVVLLISLPISDPREVLIYNRYLLQGAKEGTIILSKPRAEALLLDMRHRQQLNKGAFNPKKPLDENAPLRELLAWDESRHSADNTTIVPVEDVQRFLHAVQDHKREEMEE